MLEIVLQLVKAFGRITQWQLCSYSLSRLVLWNPRIYIVCWAKVPCIICMARGTHPHVRGTAEHQNLLTKVAITTRTFIRALTSRRGQITGIVFVTKHKWWCCVCFCFIVVLTRSALLSAWSNHSDIKGVAVRHDLGSKRENYFVRMSTNTWNIIVSMWVK